MSAPAFLEFFAGGGMARIGLGPSWRCLFANENDARISQERVLPRQLRRRA